VTKARDIATSSVTTADLTAEVGSTIQAHDADLDTISGLAKTDGNVIVGDGTNWVAEDPATVRTSLGLGTAAITAATDYATAAQGATADSALQANETITLSGDVTGSGTTAITASVAPGSITEAKLSAGAGGADQILTSNGAGTLTWANAAGGGFSNMDVFTSSGTWTNPGSVTKVKVTVTGGGGGGGPLSFPTAYQSVGGAAGGTAIEVITIPTSPVPITVGSGGVSPANTSPGGTGGTSSFSTYCSATGGAGGLGASANRSAGGTGSGGAINIIGGQGGQPGGGASIWGGGGMSVLNPNAGATGQAYGSGGAGQYGNNPTGNTTRQGASGIVVVEY
jgi:hypothetical protein